MIDGQVIGLSCRKYANIAPLLDVEDMMATTNPDWKCVFTYVQSFYRRFAAPQRQRIQHPHAQQGTQQTVADNNVESTKL